MNDYRGIGRVGNTKLTYFNDGTPCMEMSVAIDQSYKKQDGSKVDKVFWCRVKAFGKQAEFIERWCHKGKRVLVVAQPEERFWEDQQGNKRSVIEFHVRAPGTGVMPIDWPDKDDQGQQQPQQARQQAQPQRQNGFPASSDGMDQMPGGDNSDVPF